MGGNVPPFPPKFLNPKSRFGRVLSQQPFPIWAGHEPRSMAWARQAMLCGQPGTLDGWGELIKGGWHPFHWTIWSWKSNWTYQENVSLLWPYLVTKKVEFLAALLFYQAPSSPFDPSLKDANVGCDGTSTTCTSPQGQNASPHVRNHVQYSSTLLYVCFSMNWLHAGSYSNSVGPSCIFERIYLELCTVCPRKSYPYWPGPRYFWSLGWIPALQSSTCWIFSVASKPYPEFGSLLSFKLKDLWSTCWMPKPRTDGPMAFGFPIIWAYTSCLGLLMGSNVRAMIVIWILGQWISSAPLGLCPLDAEYLNPSIFSKTISHCNIQNPWYVFKSYYSKKSWRKTYCWIRLIYEVVLWNITQNLNFKVYSGFQKRNIRCVPRLALWIVFNMHPNAIACMGPDCSSWGLPARGSSLRSFANIFGNVFSSWVQRCSTMITRLLAGINYICHVYWPVKFKN